MQSQTHLSIPAAMSLGLDSDGPRQEPTHPVVDDVLTTGLPVLSTLGFRQCGPARPRRRSSSTRMPRSSFSTPKRVRPEKDFFYGPPASPIAEVAIEEDKTPSRKFRSSGASVPGGAATSPIGSPITSPLAGNAGRSRDASERQAKRLANFMSRFQYAGDDPYTSAASQPHTHRGLPLNHTQLYGAAQGAIESHAARVRNQLELRAQLFNVGHDYSVAIDGPAAEELRYNPLQLIRNRQARAQASALHGPHHVVNINEMPLRAVQSPSAQWNTSTPTEPGFIWDIQLPEMIQNLSYYLSLYKKRARKLKQQRQQEQRQQEQQQQHQQAQQQAQQTQPQIEYPHQQLQQEPQKYDPQIEHLQEKAVASHTEDAMSSGSSSLSDGQGQQQTLLPAFSMESSASLSRRDTSGGSRRLSVPTVPMRSNSAGTIESSRSLPRKHSSTKLSASPYQSGSNLASKSSSMLIDRLRCSHSESSGSEDNETDSDARGAFTTRPLFCRNQHSFSKPMQDLMQDMPQPLTSINPQNGLLPPPPPVSVGGATSPRQSSSTVSIASMNNRARSEGPRRDSSSRSVSLSPTRVSRFDTRFETSSSPWQSRRQSPAPAVVVTSYEDDKTPDISWKSLGWDASTSHVPAPHEMFMTPYAHRKRGSIQASVLSFDQDEAHDITDFGSLRKNDPADIALESEQASALATSELEYVIALFRIAIRKQDIDLGLSNACIDQIKTIPLDKEDRPACDALRLKIKNDTVPQYLQYLGTVEKDVLERQQNLEADIAGPLDSLRVTADRMVSEVNTILNRQLREATARCDRLNACKDSKCLKRMSYTLLEWAVVLVMWVCWAAVTVFRTICKTTNVLVI